MGKGIKQHQKKDLSTQKVPLGKRIMCIAMGGALYQCQYCYRVVKRGMLSEYENKLYCNEQCIKDSKRVVT